jgi:hypothetical protein
MRPNLKPILAAKPQASAQDVAGSAVWLVDRITLESYLIYLSFFIHLTPSSSAS